MTKRFLNYVSPFIYPLYPAEVGALHVATNIRDLLRQRCVAGFNGSVECRMSMFSGGRERGGESVVFNVADGESDGRDLIRSFVSDADIGYVEIGLTADAPAFNRVLVEPGYAALMRQGVGMLSVIGAEKFADSRVIDQIRATGRFCLAHTACYADSARDIGDHFLFINPYERDISVRLASSHGKRLSQRVAAKSAFSLSLSPLLDDGRFGSVMVTSNNRIICYDVKTIGQSGLNPNSIDHLDPYRGEYATRKLPLGRYLRARTRQFLQETGLRLS